MTENPPDPPTLISPAKSTHRYGAILFLTFCCWYGFIGFGGIRTPDEEVLFRTAESLATHGSFAVEDLSVWVGFGTARGRDGNSYSIFGPLQSVLLVPFVVADKALDATHWYASSPFEIPASMFVASPAHPDWFLNNRPMNVGPHALRFLVSFFNALVGALLVFLFYRTADLLIRSKSVAFAAAIVFGAGTLAQPYAGTMFSEPLMTLLALWSLYCLLIVRGEETPEAPLDKNRTLLLIVSGLALGLSATAHITGVLFAPFFLLYLLHYYYMHGRVNMVRAAGFWLAGFWFVLALLGMYNYMRFGNMLETGRGIDPQAALKFGYGYFVAPWLGLYGLTFSLGKGLVWYSPAILLALPGWRLMRKKDRALAAVIAATSLKRLVFIASRFDWAGGFCPGPRYLMPMLPFLLLPFAFWLEDIMRRGDRTQLKIALGGGLVCILEQWYLSLGDTIMFYFGIVRGAGAASGGLFHGWPIYLNPEYSPLLHALAMDPTPFLLHGSLMPTFLLFLLGGAVIVAGALYLFGLAGMQLVETPRPHPPAAD